MPPQNIFPSTIFLNWIFPRFPGYPGPCPHQKKKSVNSIYVIEFFVRSWHFPCNQIHGVALIRFSPGLLLWQHDLRGLSGSSWVKGLPTPDYLAAKLSRNVLKKFVMRFICTNPLGPPSNQFAKSYGLTGGHQSLTVSGLGFLEIVARINQESEILILNYTIIVLMNRWVQCECTCFHNTVRILFNNKK